jgi:hypothetical protein
MFDMHMRMWGKFLPKRGPLYWSRTLVEREVCDFFVGEDNIFIDVVQYPYMGMDWRRFPNILFTTIEPLD